MTSAAPNLKATLLPPISEISFGRRPPTVSEVFAHAQKFEVEPRRDVHPGPNSVTSSRMQPATAASVVAIHGIKDQTKARFRMLRRLPRNHDGEGADAANAKSVDEAIAFLDAMQCSTPYFATLSDEGFAVIEFEDRSTGFFAVVMFRPDGVVECYRRKPGAPSELVEGPLDELEVRDFLDLKIGVVV